jgi:hypothetical protein
MALRRLNSGPSDVAEGEVLDAGEELRSLHKRIEELEAENRKYSREREDNERKYRLMAAAVNALRRILKPEYDAMRALFGELDIVAETVGEQVTDGPISSKRDPKWESWKQRLGNRAAEVIELLLIHGTMTKKGLGAALGVDPRTTEYPIGLIRKAGILNEGRDGYSLKM